MTGPSVIFWALIHFAVEGGLIQTLRKIGRKELEFDLFPHLSDGISIRIKLFIFTCIKKK